MRAACQVILGLCLFLCAGPPLSADGSQANQGGTSEKEVTSYQFLEAVIESLARSHLALKIVNDTLKNPSPVERMTAIQNGGIELRIAESQIQPFSSAANENVRSSAASIIGAYTTMRKSLAVSLAVTEKLDAVKSEADLVGLRRQISDAKVLYQQASLLLIDATSLAFGSGIVPDPKDPANHIALSMTPAQRSQLLKKLEARFGPLLKTKEEKDSDTGPLTAARTLRDLLEKKWRFAT
jgi:hypothetical protein